LQAAGAGIPDVPAKLLAQGGQSAAAKAPSPPSATTGTDAASTLTAELLEKTTKKLASYIGPIAGVVVKRASKKCSNAKELFLAVAGEIESAEERERFLSGLR
jgi:eukaryotic-like serine/threonine-protein kinase